MRNKHEYIIDGDVVYLHLTNTKGIKYIILFDLEDYELVTKHSWSVSSEGYVRTGRSGETKGMHRLVMGMPQNKMVDHINMDKLDNRKNNLRVCDNCENQWNVGANKANTSGYKNISWFKRQNCWFVKIQRKGIRYQKTFSNIEDAIAWRDAKMIELHGEYVRV